MKLYESEEGRLHARRARANSATVRQSQATHSDDRILSRGTFDFTSSSRFTLPTYSLARPRVASRPTNSRLLDVAEVTRLLRPDPRHSSKKHSNNGRLHPPLLWCHDGNDHESPSCVLDQVGSVGYDYCSPGANHTIP